MTQQPPPGLAPALDLLRRGDPGAARAAIDAALSSDPDSPALLAFGGLLAAQAGDPVAAIPYFRGVLAVSPGDGPARINLAKALVEIGELDEAGEVCAAGGARDPKLQRLAAYVHQEQGRIEEAAGAYEIALSAFPDDFESWNNLGNVRAARGDPDGALEAFGRALQLRPDIIQIYMNASEALASLERNEERRALMRDAIRLAPDRADVQTELGLAESALRAYVEAEVAYREAIRLDPRFLSAYLELGLLLENLNRVEELSGLVEAAEASGVADADLAFIKAWALRREGRFAEALPFAEAVPASIHPVRRAHLLAEVADRLGKSEQAFEALTEMNAASVAAKPAPPGPLYRDDVAQSAALLTPAWVSSWAPIEIDNVPSSPIFLVGFPRSGTTLLDTLLMNMPSLHVLEEMPFMREIDIALGQEARLASLGAAEANRLRRLYFELVDKDLPPAAGQTIVDKHPLRMAGMPIVNRLFPDARVILVERHPCDVIFSCFMANFQLNHAMRSFTELHEAALTYDAVFDAWTRAETLLPLRVHRVRYERMVADLEQEMRPLLDFLGLPWDETVLDNQAAAAGRGHVRTASYSQVSEPIYKRAAGRWERYRKQMEPVLPILAPWAERMGYGI